MQRDVQRRIDIARGRFNQRAAERQRLARVRTFFWRASRELFYSFNKWPRWARMVMTRVHKNNDQRYRLFLFLTYNGLAPSIAAHWIKTMDIDNNGTPVYYNYDNTAIYQLHKQMPKQLDNNDATFWGTRGIMDMHLGHVVELKNGVWRKKEK